MPVSAKVLDYFVCTVSIQTQRLPTPSSSGVAQRAATLAATTSTTTATVSFPQNLTPRHSLMTFNDLLSLGVLRNVNVTPTRSTPPTIVPTLRSDLRSSVNSDDSGATAVAQLMTEATNGTDGIPISNDNQPAGPAVTSPKEASHQLRQAQGHVEENGSDSDNSSTEAGRSVSYLNAATKSNKDPRIESFSRSHTHRVTSPPQARVDSTSNKDATSFYGDVDPKRRRSSRDTARPAAPEKKKRKEIKASKPPKNGFKR